MTRGKRRREGERYLRRLETIPRRQLECQVAGCKELAVYEVPLKGQKGQSRLLCPRHFATEPDGR